MLRKLTVDQINDWFTIGKTVTDVELLGSPPAFPAEAARDEARRGDPVPGAHPTATAPAQAHEEARQAASGRPDRQRPAELDYIAEYRQLEAQELDVHGTDPPGCCPGPRPVPTRLSSATCVPETTYRYPDLPVNRCREELISLIESNSVVIIHGATGSGKSTQLPQYVLDHCAQRSAYCHIAVTQPRKIGASSMARWISKERAWALGGLVGYQVGLEKVTTEDTRLVYMTTGVLLQKVVSAKSLAEFTHIFIDEVHERTEEVDFLLLVVRKLLRTNSRFVKVILMSATINCREFADYFAVPVQNQLSPACVFEVPGQPHEIEEHYLDDLEHMPFGRLCPHVLEEPGIPRVLYEVAVSLIQTFDDMDLRASGSKTGPGTQVAWERSSVLVFLPGLSEINHMQELLTNVVQKRLQVYPLHSSVTLEEQSNVFLSPVPGYRKIILSTNIAESSVTVPDVKYVIDFCLTRILVCDEDTNYQSLRLSWASKTSCHQRKGRAGRVSKGYCYRLVHRDFWESAIPDSVVPEMLRCPLGSTVLKVKLLDMGEPRALLATALSPPRLGDIGRTVLLLKEVGALAISGQREDENPHDGELTFLGRVLAHLPVSQQLGKLVVLGHAFGCLDECLIIAAALSLKNFFAMPLRQHLDGYRNKVLFSGNSKSDCIALVEAFKDELEWGRLNYIQIKRIREVAELYEELKNRVSQFNMHVSPRRPVLDPEFAHKQRFILQVVLAGAFYPNYFTFGQPDEEMAVRELAGKDPKTTIVLKHAPPYAFLYHKQLQSLFRQCGQVKAIMFDGAKIFVEFSRNPTERFKTLPAVYLAIKMSQLKVPLELRVHSAEEVEGRLLRGAASKLRNTRVSMDFQQQTVDPVQVSVNALDRPRLVSDLLLSDFLLTVDVTEVVEVGHFWGCRMDEKNAAILKQLSAEISRLKLVPLAIHPRPDLVCLAPFADADEPHYFRAQILYMSGGSAEVFFVDYGNKSRVALGLLMEIPCHLLQLPFQALEFRVCRLRPSARSLVCGERWSSGAGQRFAALVGGRTLLIKVFSVVHGVLHVDAYLSSGPQDVANVRDVLILEGHAELAEECYESRQSHEVLTSLFSEAAGSVTEACAPSLGADTDKHLVRVLLDGVSSNKLGTPSHKVVLHGPFNPHELKCHSLTRISKFRRVRIEKDSVNSVVVGDALEGLHQRALVAASLSLNATGSTMLLRETSLLPHIPGLPALLSMLFTPVMELRVDPAGKCYTGVLCGLGCSPDTGAPVLPEHDMELAFDVQFSVEDVLEINLLRAAINQLVCDSPTRARCLGLERVSQLQDSARQKLLGLFCQLKPRERIVPRWHERPYEWGQVDPKLVMEQAERPGGRGRSTVLYQLHRPVVLSP